MLLTLPSNLMLTSTPASNVKVKNRSAENLHVIVTHKVKQGIIKKKH